MHDTAFIIGKQFFECYCTSNAQALLEVGSQNVNGSLRDCAPEGCTYVGVDLCAGDSVDIVLDDPYAYPFDNDHFDAVVSSSCFEHDQMFWLTFLEIVRVTKPGGCIYLSAPSNGSYHAYPYDNWRFYPGAGPALAAWAKRQGIEVTLIEAFTARRVGDQWNDYVMVFRKGAAQEGDEAARLFSHFPDAYNVFRLGSNQLANESVITEDMQLLAYARTRLAERESELAALKAEAARPSPIEVRVDLGELRDAFGQFAEWRENIDALMREFDALRGEMASYGAGLAALTAKLGDMSAGTASAIADLRREFADLQVDAAEAAWAAHQQHERGQAALRQELGAHKKRVNAALQAADKEREAMVIVADEDRKSATEATMALRDELHAALQAAEEEREAMVIAADEDRKSATEATMALRDELHAALQAAEEEREAMVRIAEGDRKSATRAAAALRDELLAASQRSEAQLTTKLAALSQQQAEMNEFRDAAEAALRIGWAEIQALKIETKRGPGARLVRLAKRMGASAPQG